MLNCSRSDAATSALISLLDWIDSIIADPDGSMDTNVTLINLLGEFGRITAAGTPMLQRLERSWQHAVSHVLPVFADEFKQPHGLAMKALLTAAAVCTSSSTVLMKVVSIVFYEDSHPARALFDRFIQQYGQR